MSTTAPISATTDEKPEWMTVKTTRAKFGVGTTWIYERIKTGNLRSVVIRERGNVKGKRLINFDSMQALINKAEAGEEI